MDKRVVDNPIYGLGLCAGGLGLELGLEIAISGYRTVCVVEREISVCGRVAARVREGSIPELAIWDDVSTFDGKPWRGIVRIVSAGFPCQPFSVAGKRKGTGDERWIWPHIARIIGEVQPEIVFLENVPGLLLDPDSDFDRWAVEGEPDDALGGMGTVLRDLAGLGFDAEWTSIRASDVGASHGRKRIFILAHRNGKRFGLEFRSALFDGEWPAFGHNANGRDPAMVNAERTERWPGALGSGCDSAGIDGERETSSRIGNGEPVLADSNAGTSLELGLRDGFAGAVADSASSGPSIRRNDIGLRECETVERTSSELGNAEGRRFGIVREPSWSIGQPDGPVVDVEDSSRSGEYRLDGESGQIGGRGIRAPSEPLEHAACSEGARLEQQREYLPGPSDRELGLFAYGPSDLRWQDLLVSRPWLRPSWSQAEAESYFRNLVDGLAPLVAAERTGALRTLGNGVVPLQAALGFTVLARRAGLI